MVEDGGVAWGYGALGFVEGYADAVGGDEFEGCRGWLLAVADADLCPEGRVAAGGLTGFETRCEAGDGDPVEAMDEEGRSVEFRLGADGDAAGVGVDLEDVEGIGSEDAEALALADGEVVDALVMAEGCAGGGDQLAGGVWDGLALLLEVVGDELLVVSAGDEADFLGVWLVGEGEMAFAGDLADFRLGEVAEGEEGVCELVLGESEEEPGLVLGEVGGALEDPTVADGVEVVAGVVAGGDLCRPDLAGGEEKLVELEVVVAERAGDGRSASEVIVYEGPDDVALETLLLVDDVVGDVERLGDAAGVVDIVEGAAAPSGAGGDAGLSGEAVLIPKLEGEADDVRSLSAEHGGDGGGIDTAGHGDGDGLAWRAGLEVWLGRIGQIGKGVGDRGHGVASARTGEGVGA